MKTERLNAIVLRRTNYGEADRIIQLLTPAGRRSVMAKGVRREKSKLAGGIELFCISDVVIGQGKGELGILTSSRMITFYDAIMTDLDRLQFGYTAIKLVAKASENVDEPDWFSLLQETLAGLNSLTMPLALTEAWFYIHYANILGHRLNVTLDNTGQPLNAELRYRYDDTDSCLVPMVNGPLEAAHIKLLRLLDTKSLAVLAQVGGINDILAECLHVARQHAAVQHN